jgi:hypothetical protein
MRIAAKISNPATCTKLKAIQNFSKKNKALDRFEMSLVFLYNALVSAYIENFVHFGKLENSHYAVRAVGDL